MIPNQSYLFQIKLVIVGHQEKQHDKIMHDKLKSYIILLVCSENHAKPERFGSDQT